MDSIELLFCVIFFINNKINNFILFCESFALRCHFIYASTLKKLKSFIISFLIDIVLNFFVNVWLKAFIRYTVLLMIFFLFYISFIFFVLQDKVILYVECELIRCLIFWNIFREV